MARDISNFRTVINQVVERQDEVVNTLVQIGKQIIATSQEAKIAENFSKVQLELNQLNAQYQVDFEGDPFGGISELQESRQDIFDRHGGEISPLFKRNWNSSVKDLALKDDATTEIWGFKQARFNTVKSINTSIKNNMRQFSIDGENFGNLDTDEIGSMINFIESKSKLIEFADRNLGENKSTELFENYDDDALKNWLGGVSKSAPLKALGLLEDEKIKNGFRDQKQFADMKEAIEVRALQADKIFGQQQVINVLKDRNSLLSASLQNNIPYVDLQNEFDRIDASKSVRSFFLKVNGFKETKDRLSVSQKQKEAVGIYEAVRTLSESDDASPKEIEKLQDRIYTAMDKNAISAEDGALYIDQFVTPALENREEELSKFNVRKGNIFSDKIGFDGLDDFLDQIIIKPEIEQQSFLGIDFLNPDEEFELGQATQNLNNNRKLKLFDFYRDALQEAADVRNIKLGQLPSLSKKEKREIYSNAQNEAKKLYISDEFGLNFKDGDYPDVIITPEGVKIQTGLGGTKKSSVFIPSPEIDIDNMTEEELDRFLAQ